jgi:4-hydroxybenzoyl-CoA reductase subunit beta
VLRLPRFEVAEPTTVDDAVRLLEQHGDDARPMAGGTDLMPNMKHEIETPKVVVGLWRIDALRTLVEEDDQVRIGALNTLDSLANDAIIGRLFPSLVDALREIAGPQLRRMDTLGGNLCLDTRCVYINQTYFWRQALGFCIKKDGTVCHVVRGGRRCVAAASNDTAPVLMTLGAKLVLHGPNGPRTLPVEEFYSNDGVFNQKRDREELVTEIVIPKASPTTLSAYKKLRTRAAIDYPELGAAVLVRLDPAGLVEHAEVCVNALGARPIRVKNLEPHYRGLALTDKVIESLATAAHRRCKPLGNIGSEPGYRREMVRVFVRRALVTARSRGTTGV